MMPIMLGPPTFMIERSGSSALPADTATITFSTTSMASAIGSSRAMSASERTIISRARLRCPSFRR